MANRYLVRTRAGDHITNDEAEILNWLKQGHCSLGDYVYIEDELRWCGLSELPSIAPLFSDKPVVKLEKPVITIFKLGRGRSLQEGPFTLSAVLEMIANGDLCASSWIFVDGDKEWRQVQNVKILRESLPPMPDAPPQLAVVPGAKPKVVKDDFSTEALHQGVSAGATALGVFDVTKQSQPSIVPMPDFILSAPPPPLRAEKTATRTATLTQTFAKTQAAAEQSASFPPDAPKAQPHAMDASGFLPTTAGFVSAPDLSGASVYSLDAHGGREEMSVKIDAPSAASPPPINIGATDRFQYRQANPVEEIPEDEQTKAVSKLGLAQKMVPVPDFESNHKASPGIVVAPMSADDTMATRPPRPSATPPPPPRGSMPPPTPGKKNPPKAANHPVAEEGEEGIVVEIPQGPIWMIKKEGSEQVAGPFGFQQIIDALKIGQLSKEDKISKQGTNRFIKISQQYEFNVKYSVEMVVEGGVEVQKILIKRRHPRVSYMTDVHVMKIGRKWHGKCVNISAGGVLLEANDLDVALGEIIMLELMPGLIHRKISVSAMVIGKIPKKPPGFALKFTDLKVEDKEAIEFYVMEALKKEKAIGM